MGTSQSSDGPGPGVPMVPPWTPAAPQDDPVPPAPEGEEAGEPETDGSPANPVAPSPAVPPRSPLAPEKRFGGVRASLRNFSRSGDNRDLRRALGHYVRSGYGGTETTTNRFGGTARTAGSLGDFLYSSSSGGSAGIAIDTVGLAGRSTEQIATAIIEAVRPIDGTQDAEAERAAIHDAMSELLDQFPAADLLNLDEEQREFVIERFTAIDVARRFELDVGKHLLEKCATATVAMARLKQMRSYIAQAVAASFRKVKAQGRSLTSGRVAAIVRTALRDTFEVFQGYEE